jgi:hypothetical protein
MSLTIRRGPGRPGAWAISPGPVCPHWFNEPVIDALKAELAEADAALKAHLASWEYAFAMGSSRDGASEHPKHAATRARTAELTGRVKDLKARLAEHEL